MKVTLAMFNTLRRTLNDLYQEIDTQYQDIVEHADRDDKRVNLDDQAINWFHSARTVCGMIHACVMVPPAESDKLELDLLPLRQALLNLECELAKYEFYVDPRFTSFIEQLDQFDKLVATIIDHERLNPHDIDTIAIDYYAS